MRTVGYRCTLREESVNPRRWTHARTHTLKRAHLHFVLPTLCAASRAAGRACTDNGAAAGSSIVSHQWRLPAQELVRMRRTTATAAAHVSRTCRCRRLFPKKRRYYWADDALQYLHWSVSPHGSPSKSLRFADVAELTKVQPQRRQCCIRASSDLVKLEQTPGSGRTFVIRSAFARLCCPRHTAALTLMCLRAQCEPAN